MGEKLSDLTSTKTGVMSIAHLQAVAASSKVSLPQLSQMHIYNLLAIFPLSQLVCVLKVTGTSS